MNLYSALYYKPFISKALRYGLCVKIGSHSFTCHPHTNHTWIYSPTARHHRPAACWYSQNCTFMHVSASFHHLYSCY